MTIVQQQRREAMAILARASEAELRSALTTHWHDIGVRELKPAEAGLVMVRGRIGGDGAPFNLGEASVTRAIIELDDGTRGYGFTLGRDRGKARAAAILDALWQRDETRALVDQDVLRPVSARLVAEKARAKAETAATRVDFFTMVRGESS